jgi:hypothetical protein
MQIRHDAVYRRKDGRLSLIVLGLLERIFSLRYGSKFSIPLKGDSFKFGSPRLPRLNF